MRFLLGIITLILPALQSAAAEEEANDAARAAAEAERQAAAEAERQAWLNQQPGLLPEPLPNRFEQRDLTIRQLESEIYTYEHEAHLLAQLADSAAFQALVGEDLNVQAVLRPRAREVVTQLARKAGLVTALRDLNESEGADAPNPSPDNPNPSPNAPVDDEGGTPAAV